MELVALAVFAAGYGGYPLVHRIAGMGIDRRLRATLHRELRGAAASAAESEAGRALLMTAAQAHVRMLVFFAASAFLALGGAIGLLLNPQEAARLCEASLFANSASDGAALRFRTLAFSFLAAYAFLQFLWAHKALYHLTLAVQTQSAHRVRGFLDDLDQDLSRGLRTLYYLAILFLWFFGPEFLIVGTVILTATLWRYDSRVVRI